MTTLEFSREELLADHPYAQIQEEAGYKLQCFECGSCNGKGDGRRSNVQIAVHGSSKRHALTILQPTG